MGVANRPAGLPGCLSLQGSERVLTEISTFDTKQLRNLLLQLRQQWRQIPSDYKVKIAAAKPENKLALYEEFRICCQNLWKETDDVLSYLALNGLDNIKRDLDEARQKLGAVEIDAQANREKASKRDREFDARCTKKEQQLFERDEQLKQEKKRLEVAHDEFRAEASALRFRRLELDAIFSNKLERINEISRQQLEPERRWVINEKRRLAQVAQAFEILYSEKLTHADRNA